MDFNRVFVSQLSSSTDDVPATKRDLMEKQEATQRLVYRLLEEVQVLQNSRVPPQENAKSPSILPRESFLSKEEFMSFEKKIQSSEEYFSTLTFTFSGEGIEGKGIGQCLKIYKKLLEAFNEGRCSTIFLLARIGCKTAVEIIVNYTCN